MYELTIKVLQIMDETNFHKYTIQEIQEMKAILEQFKDQTIELELHRIGGQSNEELQNHEPPKRYSV